MITNKIDSVACIYVLYAQNSKRIEDGLEVTRMSESAITNGIIGGKDSEMPESLKPGNKKIHEVGREKVKLVTEAHRPKQGGRLAETHLEAGLTKSETKDKKVSEQTNAAILELSSSSNED